eukprot:g488.t1
MMLAVMPGCGSGRAFHLESFDSLNVPIHQNLPEYVLPADSIFWHGTVAPFPEFDPSRTFATWFGGCRETSSAMGIFRLRQAIKVGQISYRKADWTRWLDNENQYTSNNLKSFSFENWPKLMKVKATTSVKLMYVPFGKEGHWRAFKRIGYDIAEGAGNGRFSLNGVQSALNGPVQKIFEESGICDWLKKDGGKELFIWDETEDEDGNFEYVKTDVAAEFCGWRAPFDQDEFAICSHCLDKFSIEGHLEVLKDALNRGVSMEDYQRLSDLWYRLPVTIRTAINTGDTSLMKEKLKALKDGSGAAAKEGDGADGTFRFRSSAKKVEPPRNKAAKEEDHSEVSLLKEYVEHLFKMLLDLPVVSAKVYSLPKEEGAPKFSLPNSGAFDINSHGLEFLRQWVHASKQNPAIEPAVFHHLFDEHEFHDCGSAKMKALSSERMTSTKLMKKEHRQQVLSAQGGSGDETVDEEKVDLSVKGAPAMAEAEKAGNKVMTDHATFGSVDDGKAMQDLYAKKTEHKIEMLVSKEAEKSETSGDKPSLKPQDPIKDGTRAFYSLEELLKANSDHNPNKINLAAREEYLSDEDFLKVFKMERSTFLKLPGWRRLNRTFRIEETEFKNLTKATSCESKKGWYYRIEFFFFFWCFGGQNQKKDNTMQFEKFFISQDIAGKSVDFYFSEDPRLSVSVDRETCRPVILPNAKRFDYQNFVEYFHNYSTESVEESVFDVPDECYQTLLGEEMDVMEELVSAQEIFDSPMAELSATDPLPRRDCCFTEVFDAFEGGNSTFSVNTTTSYAKEFDLRNPDGEVPSKILIQGGNILSYYQADYGAYHDWTTQYLAKVNRTFMYGLNYDADKPWFECTSRKGFDGFEMHFIKKTCYREENFNSTQNVMGKMFDFYNNKDGSKMGIDRDSCRPTFFYPVPAKVSKPVGFYFHDYSVVPVSDSVFDLPDECYKELLVVE